MGKSASQWAKDLKMQPHPEGGYYVVDYVADQTMISNAGNTVSIATGIYFILEANNASNFHRLQSDEMWYFHEGNPLTVHCIYPDGRYEQTKLGRNFDAGEQFHYLVPKGVIFGSSCDEGFSLVSCQVTPGIVFEEFELFKRNDLLQQYPQHSDIIHKLTRD